MIKISKKPVIYNQIQERLMKSTNGLGEVIDLKKCKIVLSSFGIPKHLVYKILKDMEEYKLVKQVNQRHFKIIKKKTEDRGWFS